MVSSEPQEHGNINAPAGTLPRWLTTPLAILAWLAVAIVVFWVLSYVLHTILLLVLAGLIAYAVTPVVNLLARSMPRYLAIIIVYVVFLGLLGTLGYFVINTAVQQSVQFVSYLHEKVTPGSNGQPSQLVSFLRGLGLSVSESQVEQAGTQIIGGVQNLTSSVLPVILSFFSAVLDIVITLVLSIYLTAAGHKIPEWLAVHIPLRYRRRSLDMQETVQRVAGGYIRGQVTVALLVSSIVCIVLLLLHVQFAILLGLVVFVLEFIPVLGSLISGSFCVVVALSSGWEIAFSVLVVFVAIHVLDGYVLSPRIVGRAVGLNPAVAIVALLIGSELFGIWGALLAAPVTGTLQALAEVAWREWRRDHPEEYPPRLPAPESQSPKQKKAKKPMQEQGQTDTPPAPVDTNHVQVEIE